MSVPVPPAKPPPTAPPQRSAWLAVVWVALMAMLAVALGGWWFGDGGPGRAGSATPSPPPAASSASGGLGSAPAQVLSAVALAPLAAVPAAVLAAVPGSAPPASLPPAARLAPQAVVKQVGRWQLCVSEGRPDPATAPVAPAASASLAVFDLVAGQRMQDQVDRELAAAWPELLARLATSPVPRQQAAAMLLSALPMLPPPGAASGPRLPPAPTPAARTRLVDLALSSADPVVRHWAMDACAGSLTDGACSRFTARHWVRLDPGNVWPWMYLLVEEPRAQDEALHGMAGAQRVDSAGGHLALAVEQAWPARLPAYLRAMALTRASALASALWSPPFRSLAQLCRADEKLDQNRLQHCERIGRLLSGQASELLTRRIGLRLQASATGTSAKALADDPWPVAEPLPGAADLQPFGCTAVAEWRTRTRALATEGEVAWLRRQQAKPVGSGASAAGG